MTTSLHALSREELAERFIAAREQMQRWSARDFKRRGAPLDLTQTQYGILCLVDASDGMIMSALADRLDLSPPTVVRAVDALERKRLVTRRRSSRDHREVAIVATAEGMEIQGQVRRARHDRLMGILATLTDEELFGLIRGYEALARGLVETDADMRAAV